MIKKVLEKRRESSIQVVVMNAITGSASGAENYSLENESHPFQTPPKSALQDPIRIPSVGHANEAGYYSGRVLHGHEP